MGKRSHAGFLLGALLLVSARARGQDGASPSSSPDRVAELEKKVRELEARLRRVEPPPKDAPAPPKLDAPVENAGKGQARPGAPPTSATKAVPGDPEGLRGAPGPVIRPPPKDATVLEAALSAIAQLRLYGGVDVDYFWKIQDPHERKDAIQLHSANPDHDTFEVAWSKLGVTRRMGDANEWDAGFGFELDYGRLVQKTLSLDPRFLPDSPINSQFAYVDLKIPTPLNPVSLRCGRTQSWIGVETIDPFLNPNFSHSFFFNFSPFTTTGVSASSEIAGGFRYTQWVVNGWDLVIDDNSSKTLGGQLSWTSEGSSAAIAFNWIWGPEREKDDRHHRWYAELAATLKPFDGTEVRASLHYGQEEGGALGGGPAKFGGVLLIVRQELYEVTEGFRRFAVAFRGEYYRDQGGLFSGVDETLAELTGTFELRFTDSASLRLEYRHDIATGKGTLHGLRGHSAGHQDTIGADANFRF